MEAQSGIGIAEIVTEFGKWAMVALSALAGGYLAGGCCICVIALWYPQDRRDFRSWPLAYQIRYLAAGLLRWPAIIVGNGDQDW